MVTGLTCVRASRASTLTDPVKGRDESKQMTVLVATRRRRLSSQCSVRLMSSPRPWMIIRNNVMCSDGAWSRLTADNNYKLYQLTSQYILILSKHYQNCHNVSDTLDLYLEIMRFANMLCDILFVVDPRCNYL